MKKALVSLAVGERCHRPWQRFLRPSWLAWCERNGYEMIVFESPLDTSIKAQNRSLAWQKLLAMASFELSHFDAALWIDADVLLCPWAPDPLVNHPPELVGMAMDSGSPMSSEPIWFRQCFSEILAASLSSETSDSKKKNFSYLELWGFDPAQRPLFNSGVIAYSPAHHADLLRNIYHKWDDGGPGALYEMIPLNLTLQQLNMLHEVDQRYNKLFGVYYAVWSQQRNLVPSLHSPDGETNLHVMRDFAKRLSRASYFLHFAGVHGTMEAILEQGCLI